VNTTSYMSLKTEVTVCAMSYAIVMMKNMMTTYTYIFIVNAVAEPIAWKT